MLLLLLLLLLAQTLFRLQLGSHRLVLLDEREELVELDRAVACRQHTQVGGATMDSAQAGAMSKLIDHRGSRWAWVQCSPFPRPPPPPPASMPGCDGGRRKGEASRAEQCSQETGWSRQSVRAAAADRSEMGAEGEGG